MEFIKSTIGEEKYNKLNEYYETLKLKGKSKNGYYWDEYNVKGVGPNSNNSTDYLYDIKVSDQYEHYILQCNSEEKTPVGLEEYINNMGVHLQP